LRFLGYTVVSRDVRDVPDSARKTLNLTRGNFNAHDILVVYFQFNSILVETKNYSKFI